MLIFSSEFLSVERVGYRFLNMMPFKLAVKPGCTAEPQRPQREIFLLPQSGDGDWSRSSVSSEIRSNPFTALALIVSLVTEKQKSSCLSASPDKQEILSLRPRRLCGENSFLDKYDVIE